ncbi:MAG: SIMPL domain-containing protein [Azospirillaceae bacterium]
MARTPGSSSTPAARPAALPAALPLVAAALVLALGIAAAGWFAARGLVELRAGDRYVTVKGIAEREVRADLAIWPLRFVATADALGEAQAKIDADTATIRAFLEARGLAGEAVTTEPPSVIDRLAQPYQSGPIDSRFIVNGGVTVRSTDVDAVDAASREVGALVESGVILAGDGGPNAGTPAYLFTGLSAVKPEMIAEATANARRGAEQFAADSGSRVGGIRTANQGLFQILARDDAPGLWEARQIDKTVRVVSTIEYRLVD